MTINAIDTRHWPSLRAPITVPPLASPVQVQLSREGDRYTAVVQPTPGAPERLAAYWAVTENQHASAVRAGENRGETLAHDVVVREYRPVPLWATASKGARTLRFSPASTARSATHPRQVNLVVVDATSGRPVQAVKLGC